MNSDVNWITCERRSIGLALGSEPRAKNINPREQDQDKLMPRTAALSIWDYLIKEPDLEMGCLIIKDAGKFGIVPFVNTDPTCATIRMGVTSDYDAMVELHMKGLLWGWAHSHPHGSPYPSLTDLSKHAFPVNMVIWGGGQHRLSILSTREVNLLHDYVTKQQPGLSPTIALERLCKTT